MSHNILVATSTFAVHSSDPLDLLKQNNDSIVLNPLARKLTTNELLKLAKDVEGIIAGTEVYTKEILNNI